MDADNLSGRRNLSEEAYDAIRRLIISGGLAPGEHIAVKSLSDRFGLSPTPIRTALAQLAGDGLLEAQDRRGYFVPALNQKDLLDIYELREALDAVASHRVASLDERGSLVDHLRQVMVDMGRAVDADDLGAYSDLDVEFHGSIWKAADNHRLMTIANNLLGQQRASNQISAQVTGRPAQALLEHAEIINAIEAGDAERTERATRHHVHQAKLALQDSLSQ